MLSRRQIIHSSPCVLSFHQAILTNLTMHGWITVFLCNDDGRQLDFIEHLPPFSEIGLSNPEWKIFSSSVLSHPCCSIQELSIRDYGIHVVNLAEELAANRSLKHLFITCNRPKITKKCWKVLFQALCVTSSIERTFFSNHTFHQLVVSEVIYVDRYYEEEKRIPDKIAGLLFSIVIFL
jgi:hypothetical protein